MNMTNDITEVEADMRVRKGPGNLDGRGETDAPG